MLSNEMVVSYSGGLLLEEQKSITNLSAADLKQSI